MRLALKIAGALLSILILAAGGTYVWASTSSARILSRTFEVHTVTFMMPYAQNMTEVELEALWTCLRSVSPMPSRP
ncbi:MAG TPA: hypothetical protein DC060_17010 [Gemmatimonadetes bacterium]|jgi:L-asparaginase/Glu-tRNA(Gln) amidotransferase subunit D|nr:hypothetical protein [Gemmatimonadota bacterium]HAC05512.1 hypothetical protein [Gemmatimonadota bacterium]HBD99886.1 hypothetical protein [Gemmatimonadota bacterium]HIC54332.1 hypothetical protein [Gemmatimonadota bacterium]HIN51455.1 hypothetical protein [Gemmatimonadota bacterium]|tara:strand:+ start:2932 stop:3159 length:228 start_codon:yes stop_codon:yes gene_type:complete